MSVIDKWDARTCNAVLEDINAEVPVEKCSVKLDDEQKAWYIRSAEALKAEREKNPGIPIGYALEELDWE